MCHKLAKSVSSLTLDQLSGWLQKTSTDCLQAVLLLLENRLALQCRVDLAVMTAPIITTLYCSLACQKAKSCF